MKNLYKGLASFQQDVPTIKKNASGYGYKFADLEEITKVIKPLMKKHGLGYTQPLDGNNLKTILFHIESGETLESSVEVPQGVELKGQNAFQVQGSAITYLRRYSLSSILGLVTDEDADAAGEQVRTKKAATSATSGADAEILARAKYKINEELTKAGYDTAPAKQMFIKSVLNKDMIGDLNDADLVMDAIEAEATT